MMHRLIKFKNPLVTLIDELFFAMQAAIGTKSLILMMCLGGSTVFFPLEACAFVSAAAASLASLRARPFSRVALASIVSSPEVTDFDTVHPHLAEFSANHSAIAFESVFVLLIIAEKKPGEHDSR